MVLIGVHVTSRGAQGPIGLPDATI